MRPYSKFSGIFILTLTHKPAQKLWVACQLSHKCSRQLVATQASHLRAHRFNNHSTNFKTAQHISISMLKPPTYLCLRTLQPFGTGALTCTKLSHSTELRSRVHRTAECPGLEGTLNVTEFQSPSCGHEHLPPDQP